MTDIAQAVATQIANIQKRTGKSLAQLTAMLNASGLTKHGELRDYLKTELGLGYGDANTVVHLAKQSHGDAINAGKSEDEVLDGIYTGAKADLRPIHDAIMKKLSKFGEFEVAPKRSYVSLRRSKQFATVGPATKTQVEVGFNMKGVDATDRLLVIPPGGMCNYKVRLSTEKEVDAKLMSWFRTAFDSAK